MYTWRVIPVIHLTTLDYIGSFTLIGYGGTMSWGVTWKDVAWKTRLEMFSSNGESVARSLTYEKPYMKLDGYTRRLYCYDAEAFFAGYADVLHHVALETQNPQEKIQLYLQVQEKLREANNYGKDERAGDFWSSHSSIAMEINKVMSEAQATQPLVELPPQSSLLSHSLMPPVEQSQDLIEKQITPFPISSFEQVKDSIEKPLTSFEATSAENDPRQLGPIAKERKNKNIVLAYSGMELNRNKVLRDNPKLLCDVLDHAGYSSTEQVHRHLKGISTDDSLDPWTDEEEYRRTCKQIYTKIFPQKICEGYRFIAQHYQPGDKIFLTGFGRGAILARSVANMIGKVGLTNETDENIIQKAYQAYIAEANANGIQKFHQSNSCDTNVYITCLAVYDTALPNYDANNLHNLIRVDPKVEYFRHAIAIDEKRKQFNWMPAITSIRHTDSEQRLFPGCHYDVGGGHQHRGLAHRAFAWLTLEMVNCGLKVPNDYISLLQHPGIVEHVSDNEKSDSSPETEHGARQQRLALSNPLDKQHQLERGVVLYPRQSNATGQRVIQLMLEDVELKFSQQNRQCFDSTDMAVDESVFRRMQDGDRTYLPHISESFEAIQKNRKQYEEQRAVALAIKNQKIPQQLSTTRLVTTVGPETEKFVQWWRSLGIDKKSKDEPDLKKTKYEPKPKRDREEEPTVNTEKTDEADLKKQKLSTPELDTQEQDSSSTDGESISGSRDEQYQKLFAVKQNLSKEFIVTDVEKLTICNSISMGVDQEHDFIDIGYLKGSAPEELEKLKMRVNEIFSQFGLEPTDEVIRYSEEGPHVLLMHTHEKQHGITTPMVAVEKALPGNGNAFQFFKGQPERQPEQTDVEMADSNQSSLNQNFSK